MISAVARQREAKETDCQNCRKRNAHISRGCYPEHRRAQPVPISRPDLKDGEAAHHCAASVSGAVAQAGWFSTFARMKDGHLPRPGSWGEQPHRWCEAIDLIDAEVRRYEAEALEEHKQQAAKRGKGGK